MQIERITLKQEDIEQLRKGESLSIYGTEVGVLLNLEK